MKNMLQKIGAVCVIIFVSISAFAQRSFDTYAAPRTLILSAPISVPSITAANTPSNLTNSWVDIRTLDGIAKIDFLVMSNAGGSTATITLQTSNDGTNIVGSLASCSIASPTTVIYTNTYYGYTTNVGAQLSATNVYNLAGTVVNPISGTAGFATPYLNQAANPFTNTISATAVSSGAVTTIGFNAADAPRYLRAIVTPGGSVTNFTWDAVVTAMPHYSSWPF